MQAPGQRGLSMALRSPDPSLLPAVADGAGCIPPLAPDWLAWVRLIYKPIYIYICYIIVCLWSITEPSQTLESQGKLTGKPGLCEWQG